VDRRPAQERPDKHVHRVTPGDHREKFQPTTIARLNEAFGDVLERLVIRPEAATPPGKRA
jgi:hypothetical protein